jgi:hypothetical protein
MHSSSQSWRFEDGERVTKPNGRAKVGIRHQKGFTVLAPITHSFLSGQSHSTSKKPRGQFGTILEAVLCFIQTLQPPYAMLRPSLPGSVSPRGRSEFKGGSQHDGQSRSSSRTGIMSDMPSRDMSYPARIASLADHSQNLIHQEWISEYT